MKLFFFKWRRHSTSLTVHTYPTTERFFYVPELMKLIYYWISVFFLKKEPWATIPKDFSSILFPWVTWKVKILHSFVWYCSLRYPTVASWGYLKSYSCFILYYCFSVAMGHQQRKDGNCVISYAFAYAI